MARLLSMLKSALTKAQIEQSGMTVTMSVDDANAVMAANVGNGVPPIK